MEPRDFTLLADLLKRRSGLALTEDKVYLLETRLLPIARQRGMEDLSALAAHVRAGADEALLTEITEAMTTNESFFFRDTKPFEQLKRLVVPEIQARHAAAKSFRIWSAACSTGQEAYSVVMTLNEMPEMQGWTYDIIGTDICRRVLDKAEAGVYSQFEVQRGLPIQLLMKYFEQEEDTWRIKAEVRKRVKFQYLNLLESYSTMGLFDIIFCRNVLIYFDNETKKDVLKRIAGQLNPGGILYLGSTETTLGFCDSLAPLENERGVFRLK